MTTLSSLEAAQLSVSELTGEVNSTKAKLAETEEKLKLAKAKALALKERYGHEQFTETVLTLVPPEFQVRTLQAYDSTHIPEHPPSIFDDDGYAMKRREQSEMAHMYASVALSIVVISSGEEWVLGRGYLWRDPEIPGGYDDLNLHICRNEWWCYKVPSGQRAIDVYATIPALKNRTSNEDLHTISFGKGPSTQYAVTLINQWLPTGTTLQQIRDWIVIPFGTHCLDGKCDRFCVTTTVTTTTTSVVFE